MPGDPGSADGSLLTPVRDSAGRMVRLLVGVLALGVLASGCGEGSPDDARVRVAAGFARLAEVAERVGGDRVRVSDLTPPGAEPHDLELSSDDLDAIEDADVVLYLGGGFQPGLAEAAGRAERSVDVLPPDDRDDPHIWLDPVRFAESVGEVERALSAVDPAGAPGYRERAERLRRELAALHQEIQAGLERCQRRVIVTAHAAFARFAERYGLEQEAITGISPEAEPDPRRLAELSDLVRRRGITHVFTERLVSPRVARALAREAGVGVAVLDPLEGRLENGYAAAMRANLATLRSVLGCT